MSLRDMMEFANGGVFACMPGCTEDCSKDNCEIFLGPAHQRSIKEYEKVVQRLVSAEKRIWKLLEQIEFLKEVQRHWWVERRGLIEVQSEEI
ncbi:hypothetical protein CDAR_396421 [Caerostris darwini]|uniref:Uncharacterized protein n=1 Tax=Caerostris darwini TaxID=1538125 RepID=A0AAV4US45_9ARAC|nr:hypothetical protein CDAR_396421 [Caerostris darwini]